MFWFFLIDNETPVFQTCPANQTYNTDPAKSAALFEWQHPIATDNSGDRPTVVCEPPSGSNFTIGITHVNCTAVDGHGNKNSCLFYVDVNGKILFLYPISPNFFSGVTLKYRFFSVCVASAFLCSLGSHDSTPAPFWFLPQTLVTPLLYFLFLDNERPILECPANLHTLSYLIEYDGPVVSDNSGDTPN